MKPTDRVCVLVGRMPWEPLLPGRQCLSRIHGHVSARTASWMVEQGLYEWVMGEKVSRRGKTESKKELAIRAMQRRTWKPKMSLDVMVLQLVP